MKVTCLQENLAHGLSIVGRAVAQRSTMPILANVLLETDGSRLRLAATNLQMGINCWIGARVDDEGSTAIPARLLGDFVNSLPAEAIDMTLDAKSRTLSLSCDRYEAEMKGMDASDFPILPTVGEGLEFSLEPSALRNMIGQVTIAAATDESRPILAGVLVDADPDRGVLTMAAADGFRLSVRSAELPADLSAPIHVIVPAKALVELAKIVGNEAEPIRVALGEKRSQILFSLTDVEVVSQLIEGNFPDYDKIIPTAFTTRAVVNTAALLNAARIASFFARDGANIVRLDLRPGEEGGSGAIQVSGQAAEVGENESEVEASVEGDALDIAFNARYLLDFLNAAGTDQVVLELTTASSPGAFKPMDDSGFTHVIMPMHVPRG